MARSQREILDDLATVSPPFDDWDRLDNILAELWRDGEPQRAITDLLAVFQRYPPEEDGCGVFWSIVHGVESLTNYERPLLDSTVAVPSEFGVTMLGRQLNGGVTHIDGIGIVDTLRSLRDRDNCPPLVSKLLADHAQKSIG